MKTAKVCSVTILCVLAATPLYASAEPGWQNRRQNPRYLLLQSMTTAKRYPISAVVIQRLAHVNDAEVEMKMEQDVFGRTRFTVWQPAHLSGLVSLDDGIYWYTYMPKHKRVIKQESPRIAQGNPAYQIYLANENYTWRREKGPDIASCPTVVVVASPKAKELPTRRYYLDSRTCLMLQVERVSSDGTKKVSYETRSLAYLKESPKLPVPGENDPEIQTRVVPTPERVGSPASASERVGFMPIVPETLPFGFIVRSIEIVGPPKDMLIAIRITDGLVTETVYQWKDSTSKRRGPFGSKAGTVAFKGIRMRLVGELPSGPAERILKSFVSRK